MGPKDEVFYSKVITLSALGILAGVLSLYPDEGLLLFVAGNFVIGGLLAISSRKRLAELGLYGVFKEFAGTAFLAFVFFWTLSLNLVAGPPVILVAPTDRGLTSLYSPVQGGLVPGELGQINVAYILKFDGAHLSMLVGRMEEGETVSLGNVTASLDGSDLYLTQSIDLPQRGDLDLGWGVLHVGDIVELEVGDRNLTLSEDQSVSVTVGGIRGEVALSPEGELVASFGPLRFEEGLVNLTDTPLGRVSPIVIREDGGLCVFFPKVLEGQRTVRVTLSATDGGREPLSGYVVVMPPGGG